MGIIEDTNKMNDGRWINNQTYVMQRYSNEIKQTWDNLNAMIAKYSAEDDTESVQELTIKKNQMITLISNLSNYCS